MKSFFRGPAAAFEALALVVTLSAASACSSDEDKGAPSNTGGSAGNSSSNGGSNSSGSSNGGSGNAATVDPNVHGSVVLSFVPPADEGEGHVNLLGRFFDAATPDPFPMKLSEELGECRLLVPALPFCKESCAPAVCTGDDECTPYPKPQDVGTLHVAGLGDPLDLTPKSTMLIYQPASLAYPPCAPGDAVTVKGQGIALDASCVTPLELTGDDPIPVKTGESVKVSWVAQPGDVTRVRLGLDVSHHGGKKGQIDCEVPDTGSFEIPASLVTKLIDLGLAGFPTINVNRVSVGTSSATPNLTLLVSSDITRAVDTGVESCLDDTTCEAPETCLPAGICGE